MEHTLRKTTASNWYQNSYFGVPKFGRFFRIFPPPWFRLATFVYIVVFGGIIMYTLWLFNIAMV